MAIDQLDTSSRIFVKGLPPNLNENAFRKHFASSGGQVTEARVFPDRRIGYVGYKTAKDAVNAVKYFDKSFIRMSRIRVELSRPPQTAGNSARSNGGSTVESASTQQNKAEGPELNDPKLKEFLEAMKPISRKRGWEQEMYTEEVAGIAAVGPAQDDSAYEDLPRNTKKQKQEPLTPTSISDAAPSDENILEKDTAADLHAAGVGNAHHEDTQTLSDDAWARCHTHRLLDRVEVEKDRAPQPQVPATKTHIEPSSTKSKPIEHEEGPVMEEKDETSKLVRSSMRLFLRNLAYNTTNEDLEAEFSPFGHLEEVSHGLCLPSRG